ncbi:acyloxyacyl hydrolase [Salinimonas lutimaris]|uniref:acyloxyacyl hydrolase n=1 Tax=Salinimonas lutimaris TaxID=914153 RepID=UPI0010C10D08|nr:acyloxyacyl hydrolase [Salinimonas lutimaris]
MKPTLLFIFLPLALLFSAQLMAREQAVAIDYLNGSDDIEGIRLAYRPLTHDLTTSWFGDIELYWEVSANFWEYGDQNTHTSNYAVAISPVIVKHLTTIADKYPVYLEAGIGASLVDDRTFAGKDIGSHYQFEDRIGFIFSLDNKERHQVSVRYMHYSNAGLSNDNPGLDFITLSYIRNF